MLTVVRMSLWSCNDTLYTLPISYSEYFVRNPVQSAYQQDLVVHGVKCVSYKVCSVYCTNVPFVLYKVCNMYCTRCAVCIVQGVQCVLYTQQTSKSSVNKEDFKLKSNII